MEEQRIRQLVREMMDVEAERQMKLINARGTRMTCLEDDVKGLRGDSKEFHRSLRDLEDRVSALAERVPGLASRAVPKPCAANVLRYEDCLLQPLPLPAKSPILVAMQNGRVELRIGPHEWAWDMRTGELTERHILNLGHFPP